MRKALPFLATALLVAVAVYFVATRGPLRASRQLSILKAAAAGVRPSAEDLRAAGLVSAGYSRRFRRGETGQIERELGFHVFPDVGREERSAVVWLVPERPDGAGLDLLADAGRRAVLERARDTGAVARSDSGDFFCLPSYRGGAPPATLEERRAALTGWAFGARY